MLSVNISTNISTNWSQLLHDIFNKLIIQTVASFKKAIPQAANIFLSHCL